MTKTGWILAIITVLVIVAALTLFIWPAKTQAPTTLPGSVTGTGGETPASTETTIAQIPDTIVAQSLYNGSAVSSPLAVTGIARGPWYFEASFPIEIRNASGTIIAQGPAQAQGDWMTQNFVPFSATLTFPAQPAGSIGSVILKKDNPSGDPARDQSLIIPVTFL